MEEDLLHEQAHGATRIFNLHVDMPHIKRFYYKDSILNVWEQSN